MCFDDDGGVEMSEEFEKYWSELSDEEREDIKALVIARYKNMPDNLRLSVG